MAWVDDVVESRSFTAYFAPELVEIFIVRTIKILLAFLCEVAVKRCRSVLDAKVQSMFVKLSFLMRRIFYIVT